MNLGVVRDSECLYDKQEWKHKTQTRVEKECQKVNETDSAMMKGKNVKRRIFLPEGKGLDQRAARPKSVVYVIRRHQAAGSGWRVG